MFITACICVLDPRQHVVAIANAGHPAPLLLRRGANSVETLTGVRRSFPLGISLTFELHPLTQTLEPGDQLLLFTDGVSEAMNPRNDLYGTERLCGLMTRVWPDLDGLVAAIVADVELFRDGRAPSDDTTILAFGRRDFSGV
jgi:serine phosphatase RsbU (regulator of sigma subunit)